MNSVEARRTLEQALAAWRRPYAQLVSKIGDCEHSEVRGASGVAYQIQVDILWGGKPGGAIRLMGAIDDGSITKATLPITDSLLVAPPNPGEPGAV